MSYSIEMSTIFEAAESISYVKGSVVSKTIIKKPSGNITLFAFDKGEGLVEHVSPYEAVVQILDGDAEIVIGGVSNSLKSGQSIILPANIPHSLKANGQFKMMLTMIKS